MSVQSNSSVRVRFAPSPTGMLHVGGARTALFNYLFARSRGGSYLLRVEDSDKQRSTPEALEAIIDGLRWLGIQSDEEPVFQSKREALYLATVQKMLRSGRAYPCTMTMEELDALREEQKAKGLKPKYDGRCRPPRVEPQSERLPTGQDAEPFVIRLRLPEREAFVFTDEILGVISTPATELDDFILVRSDGSPTYNLVNAVDDIEMGITHVLRGNEHVANTPKQLAVIEAIEAHPPFYAHFPLILGTDKKKLSKRHGATAVFAYKDDGYLSDAFVNYLARLGWSDGDEEIFSRSELEKRFALSGVGKSPSVFDTDKLRWVNAEHLRQLSAVALKESLLPFLEKAIPQASVSQLSEKLSSTAAQRVLTESAQRAKTLVELSDSLQWLFVEQLALEVSEKDRKKAFPAAMKEHFVAMMQIFSESSTFEEAVLEEKFSRYLEANELGFGKLGQPLRLALTAQKGGVPVFLAMEALGQESVRARMEAALHLYDK